MLDKLVPEDTLSEGYQSLLVAYKDLMVSKWPKYKETLNYSKEEKTVEKMKEIIVEIRNIRNTNHQKCL